MYSEAMVPFETLAALERRGVGPRWLRIEMVVAVRRVFPATTLADGDVDDVDADAPAGIAFAARSSCVKQAIAAHKYADQRHVEKRAGRRCGGATGVVIAVGEPNDVGDVERRRPDAEDNVDAIDANDGDERDAEKEEDGDEADEVMEGNVSDGRDAEIKRYKEGCVSVVVVVLVVVLVVVDVIVCARLRDCWRLCVVVL